MPRKQAQQSNGNSAAAAKVEAAIAPSSEEVQAAKQQHKIIKDAQNTQWKHAYFKPDLNDPQILGGNKENTLVHYNPGIVISEKGREKDKKLDQHEEYVNAIVAPQAHQQD